VRGETPFHFNSIEDGLPTAEEVSIVRESIVGRLGEPVANNDFGLALHILKPGVKYPIGMSILNDMEGS